jgi:hypothetical protein
MIHSQQNPKPSRKKKKKRSKHYQVLQARTQQREKEEININQNTRISTNQPTCLIKLKLSLLTAANNPTSPKARSTKKLALHESKLKTQNPQIPSLLSALPQSIHAAPVKSRDLP